MTSRLWSNRDFLKLWAGQTVSQIGSRISRDGIPFAAVIALNASPAQMGLLSGAGAAAVLVFGLLAGAWSDRLRRRPVLIGADVARAVVLGTIPAAAVFAHLTMGHLYVAAALAAILTVLFDSSYGAYIPVLVEPENIIEGNARLAQSDSIAEIVGPGLTGILVQTITAPIAILFDALSFVVSAVSLASIRKTEPRPERVAQPHMFREIYEGLSTSWHHPVLRALLLSIATGTFFIGFVSALYILYARSLGLTPAALGLIISVGGAANLAGSLAAERVVKRLGLGRSRIVSAMTLGLGAFLLPLAHGPVWMCALYLCASQIFDAAWPVLNVADITLRQTLVPEKLRGRVNSAVLLMFRGVLPLGALLGGVLAEHIGMRATLAAGAGGFLLSSLWLVFSPLRDAP